MFLQQLFNGLSVGSIYALMAVGYSLIYSLLNFTNFAHSLTVTLGAFVAFFVTSTALQNLTVGILAAVAVAAFMFAICVQYLEAQAYVKNTADEVAGMMK